MVIAIGPMTAEHGQMRDRTESIRRRKKSGWRPHEKDIMKALESQVAVVTGAGRGAGEAIACRLATMGAHVFLVARSAEQLNRVREHIVQAGGIASAFPCNLMDAPAVAELGNVVAEKHKRCDILV